MTSTVKVTAHCAGSKHVEVRVSQTSDVMHPDTVLETYFLEDGESKEVYIYDNRYVITRELDKQGE